MAVDLATLALKVEALEVDAASKKLDNLTAAGGRTERAAGGVTSAFKAVGSALAAVAFAQSIRQAVELADSYTRIEGRLKLVTSSATELASVQNALYAISQRSRAEYLATADVYNRFAQATKGQGIAQAELLGITETLNKAFAISGASTSEAAGAMVQLSQGFSSGVLRGDEFNTVMESGGRVVDLLADYLGVGRGELRGMAEDGKLTSDVLRNAIVSGAAKVNEEFGRMPTTVGQAGTVLVNVIGQYVNDANKATGATEGIAEEITNLANTAERHRGEIVSVFTDMARSAREVIPVVISMGNHFSDDFTTIIGLLAAAKAGQLAFNAVVAANPYVAAAGALGVLNEALRQYNLNIGSLKTTSQDFGVAVGNMWDVVTGKRDFDTGKVITGVDQIHNKIAGLREQLSPDQPWYNFQIFPDASDQAAHIQGVKDQITGLQKGLTDMTFISEQTGKTFSEAWIESHDVLGKTNTSVGNLIPTAKLSADALEKLHGRLTPVHEAQVQYKKDLEEIEKAHKSGQLVGAVYSEALKTAKDRLDKATGASKEHKAALTEAGKAAKASAQEYQSILDSLEPVRVEQEEYNKALAVLNKMDPTHETERYKEGLKQLNSTLSENIELEEYRKDIIGQRADYEKQVAQASMSDAEIRIDNINRELLALEEYGQRLVGLGEAEQAIVDANNEAFGERASKQIEAITDDAGEMGKMFDDVAKSIQGAFSDMFMDMMNDTDNALDSIGEMFKTLIAEMATMAIARPIIIPITAGIGTAMGLSDSSIAKTLGVDTTQISGASGLGGIGGLFSSGSTIAGGSASLLSGWGADLAFSDSAFSGLSSTLFDVSDLLNQNLTLSSGILAGVGSLAMSLFSGDGITAQSASQAGGAAIGTVLAAGNPLGGVLGGIVGNLIGGMFGTGVDTFGPQYMANDVGVNYNATTGMTPTTKQYTGGDTDSQIAKVYAEQMRSIQAAFDDQVTALAEALPDEISSAMLASLSSANLKQILNNVSGQEINVADAASWMEGVAEAYSEGLLAELGKAYGSALSSFISTNGAEGLVGDSVAWSMLTEAVKQNITDSFQSAAATIAGGDIETGLSTINSVTNAIAAIESAMAPITEIIATDGLTEYEKSIRSINLQFDSYRDALKSAGVDMEKYTDLEKARGIALSQVVNPAIQEAIDKEKELSDARKGVDDPVSEIIATNGMSDYEKQIRSINQQFDDYRDTLKASQGTQAELDRVEQARAISLGTVVLDAVTAAKEGEIELAKTRLSAAESGLQASFSAEQSRADEAHQEALESFNATLATTKDSLATLKSLSATLNSALNGMQENGSVVSDLEQRQMAQTSLTAAVAAARGGDFSLASSLSNDTIGRLTRSSENLFATRAEYEADYLKTYAGLTELQTLADAQATDAEQTVALLEQQIANETERYEWQKTALTSQLSSILGIDESVLSFHAAITAYEEAKTARDTLALDYARLQLEATDNLATAQYAVSDALTSASAGSGTSTMIEAPVASGSTDSGASHNVLAQVAALRAEMRAAMTVIASNTKKTAEMADKWDNDGLPGERT